jgi:hypothetical protein
MSKPLCHTLLDSPLELGDMALVCPDVYKTLLKLQQIVKQKKAIRVDDKLSAAAKVSSFFSGFLACCECAEGCRGYFSPFLFLYPCLLNLSTCLRLCIYLSRHPCLFL